MTQIAQASTQAGPKNIRAFPIDGGNPLIGGQAFAIVDLDRRPARGKRWMSGGLSQMPPGRVIGIYQEAMAASRGE